MAESDSRLETLEDEVKVLKGEVKRTLVDLRALLMQEDSPLGEGALARRVARPDQGADDDTPPEGAAGEPGQHASSATPEQPVATAPLKNGSRSSEDALLEAGLDLPSTDLPGGPPQNSPGPGPVPGVVPGPLAGDQGDPPNGAVHEPASLDSRASEGDEGLPDPSNREVGPKTQEAREAPPAEESKEGRKPQRAAGWSEGPGHTSGEASPDSSVQNGRSGSVYDEYRELLEETRQTHPVEDSPVGPPLDINLLSNLVYWAALAKQRVGEDQLKDILQLYIQSGHSRPELQDLLLQISDMVEPDPAYISENPREWVDLMFHLHGILTGGFPVIKLPPIRLSARGGAERDQD